MKKLIKLVVVCVVAMVSLAGPFRSFAEDHAPADSQGLRLGATVPLSGDFATYGNLIRDGILLAQADLREEGIPADVFFEDTPLPGPSVVTAVQALLQRRHIQALVGNFFNPAIPVMAPALKRAGLTAFHSAAPDDQVLASGDFVFSTSAAIRAEASALAEYAYHTLGARSASILYVTTNFGMGYEQHFARRFQELGGRILISETTPMDTRDYRTLLLKVKEQRADIWVAGYFGTMLGAMLRQSHELGVPGPVLTPYETEDPSVLEGVRGLPDDYVRFLVAEAAENSVAGQSFKRRFTERFGYAPCILAANAYDATMIAARALRTCAGEIGCMKEQIGAIRGYDGASGRFDIGESRAAVKPFVLKTIRGGKFCQMAGCGMGM